MIQSLLYLVGITVAAWVPLGYMFRDAASFNQLHAPKATADFIPLVVTDHTGLI